MLAICCPASVDSVWQMCKLANANVDAPDHVISLRQVTACTLPSSVTAPPATILGVSDVATDAWPLPL